MQQGFLFSYYVRCSVISTGDSLISHFPGGSDGKASAYNVGDLGSIPGREDTLEKEMVTHSSILAWKIPWTEDLGGLQSGGCKESDMTEHIPPPPLPPPPPPPPHTHTHTHTQKEIGHFQIAYKKTVFGALG